MLQSIRDRTTGWVATAIVALLIIPFAFWGINYYFTGGKEPVVAKVNGEEIKLSQYQRTYANYSNQMQAIMEKNLSAEDEVFLKKETLLKLVENGLLNRLTLDAGMYVGDEQIKESIKNIDMFKGDDGFNRDFYEVSVRQLGLTPAAYEQQLRFDLMSEQLQSAIIESEFSTLEEARQIAALENQHRDLKYVLLQTSQYADSIEISDEDILRHYKNHPENYTRPETVRLTYVELKLEDLAKNVTSTEEDVLSYYEDNKAKYDLEEQRKLTQILFKADKEMTDSMREEARSGAEKVIEQLNGGISFEDIIKEFADNQNANILISEHGYMSKGVLPEAVETSVFDMDVGTVSKIIETDRGFHILKLEDIKGGIMNTFENNRELAEQDYRNSIAEEQFFDLADQLGTMAFEHPDSLDVAAEVTGLEIKQTEFFDRNGNDDDISSNPKVIKASFSDDVLQQRLNSDLLEISDRHLVVLRVSEHQEEAILPLEDVSEDVIRDIRAKRSSLMARKTGERIIAKLESGKSFETVSEEETLNWQTATDIGRNDISINRSVLRKSFALPGPESNKPSIGGVALGTGDYAVVAVLDARQKQFDEIKGKEIDETMTQIQAYRSAASWHSYMAQLMSEADISLFEDRIQ